MSQKKLYFMSALFSAFALFLFAATFIYFLATTTDYLGLESYIYWLICQLALTIISVYKYRIVDINRQQSIRLFIIYLIPLILYTGFVVLRLGIIHINVFLFTLYSILYITTTFIYLASIFVKK